MSKKILIAQSSIIQTQAKISPTVQIEDFCVIGTSGSEPVIIGQDCRIRSHAVLYHGVSLGDRVQIGHGALVREFSVIGDDVSIGSHSVIEHHVILERKARVHSNVFIPEMTHIEENVWIGPCVVFTNARYPAASRTKEFLAGVKVKKNAKIGAGVVILPGITIGEGALIGAGAVVTTDVPPGKIIVGNPGRVVSDIQRVQYPDGSQVYEQ